VLIDSYKEELPDDNEGLTEDELDALAREIAEGLFD